MNERLDYDFPRDTGPLTGPAAFPQVPPQVAPPMPQPILAEEMIAPMRLPITDSRIGFAMQDAIQPIPPRLPMQPAREMITESIIGETPAMNLNETALAPMPPIRPAGEMLGERQLTPMDQAALPMQAQADLTRTATMGTPAPIENPWAITGDNKYGIGNLPMTPGTQGFLDLQDPYFQYRWDTGYRPFLNRLAGAMFPPYGAYNLYNQFIR